MKRYIVTTTINRPTKATIAYAQMAAWHLIVVGDAETPHESYEQLDCIYLHPDEQKRKYPALSKAIGWNCIQRRNIGFVEAYHRGADVVASVDDDNIPYANWGTDLYVGQDKIIDLYHSEVDVFDPLSVTNINHLWHRGYPVEYLRHRHRVKHIGKTKRHVLIQADLWDGDPDVDAIARIFYNPLAKLSEIKAPYCSSRISPFNSQNTFLAREVIPYYAVYPYVGRMDDIWGGYFLQFLFPESLIYNRASVFQDRNPHNIITNLENEIMGYRETLKLLTFWQNRTLTMESMPLGVPEKTLSFYRIYRDHF